MAKAEFLIPFILKFEGGFVNDQLDRGGATNKGITIGTFRQFFGKDATVEQLKNITNEEWMRIFKSGYWDRWKADRITNQSVANILVDWVWTSGVYGIKIPQRVLGIMEDGIVGEKTLAALNTQNSAEFFTKIHAERIKFVDDIVRRNPTQVRFIKGWKNRINDIKFTA
ncbi:MAG: glycosyl hydrolase 108 family protein [Bacteroidales bacterium]